MIEDRSMNAFLKEKLEEGVEVPAFRSSRRVVSWRRPALLAATLAAACGLSVWYFSSVRSASVERNVVSVIEFLEECDGGTRLASVSSLSERLLAWQDAPYSEVLQ